MLSRKFAIALAAAALSGGVLAANAAAGNSGPSQATFGAPPGGFAAYHGTAMAADAKKAPANKKLAYKGRKLGLAQSYIGRNAAEPTLGVGLTGAIYTVAADFD